MKTEEQQPTVIIQKESGSTVTKVLFVLAIILLIVVGAFGWLYKYEKNKRVEVETKYKVLNDTVKTYVNEKGQSVSKIARLETANVKAFLQIKNLTSSNKRLQEAVSINKDRLGSSGSVIVFDTDTKADITVKTEITPKEQELITSVDPTHPDTIKVYPEYKSQFALGKWITGSTVANRDSTQIKLGVYNEYTVVNGEDDVPGTGFLGLWKDKQPFSEITNLNPYSTSPVVKSYSVKQSPTKKKIISFGPQAGINFQGKTYIGIGAQLNILSLF